LSYALKVIPKSVAVAATKLHDGTNGQGHDDQVIEFLIEAVDDTFIGGSDVSGDTNGITICAGEIKSFEASLSRGQPGAFDLKCIYYFGGPFKLIIVREANAND